MPWPAYWKPHLWMTRRDAGLMTLADTCSTGNARRAEGEIDQCVGRLGRIAAFPVGFAYPIAELQPALPGAERGAADERTGAGQRQGVVGATMPQLRHGDESARLGLAIGMRHARQHLRDVAIVGQHHEGRDIALARRHAAPAVPSPEPAGLSLGFRRHLLPSRQPWQFPPEKQKGEMAAHLP